jgi:hypothetical protein
MVRSIDCHRITVFIFSLMCQNSTKITGFEIDACTSRDMRIFKASNLFPKAFHVSESFSYHAR